MLSEIRPLVSVWRLAGTLCVVYTCISGEHNMVSFPDPTCTGSGNKTIMFSDLWLSLYCMQVG